MKNKSLEFAINAIRNQAIDDCIKLVVSWRDDAKCFDNEKSQAQYIILNNLVTAINNLKTPT